MRSLFEITTERDALKARREVIGRDLADLDRVAGDETLKGGAATRWENLAKGADRIDADLARLDDEYREALRDGFESGRFQTEPGAGAGPERPAERDEDRGIPQHVRTAHDAGLRTIERHRNVLSAAAADNLDGIIRSHDPNGVDARYLAAVGDPAYNRAFGKLVADPTFGNLRFTPEETAAVQAVTAVEAERAMSIGTTTAGGFAIPFTLDPSVLLSSNGVLNPIRSIARVFTISTSQWKGVSSDGVTAAYVSEASAATDASPVLAQPVITTAQGRAFIPFSIELGMDWPGAQNELVRLVTDGRDVLDATQFLTGNGTNAPVGLLAIGTTGALTTTQRIQTTTTATYAVGDPWLLKAGLAPRFIPSTTFAAAPGTWDTTYRFVGGNSTEPIQFDTGRSGPFLGRPKVEWSTMATGSTTATRLIVAGDFSQFFIADRLGMTAELIPHLFGPAQGNLPTGQRGLYAYWRTGTVVAVANAFRYLEVK